MLKPRRRALDAASIQEIQPFTSSPGIVIIGYGRVGRTVAAICARAHIRCAVIETDIDLVRLAQSEGAEAQYGDGADPRVIERGIGPATRVVLSTIPDNQGEPGADKAVVASDEPAYRRARRPAAPGRRASRCRCQRCARTRNRRRVCFAESVLAELGVDQERIATLVREQRAAISALETP